MTDQGIRAHSYSVFTLISDTVPEAIIPIGVALWSAEKRFVSFRLLRECEHVSGLKSDAYLPFVRLVAEKIDRWQMTGKLPYRETPLQPWSDRWWQHVRSLLVHTIRLSEPGAIDCRDGESEIELLFESVVAPQIKSGNE